MTSLNISLPEALKEYIEARVASGDWGTPSEYIRDLVREDKERRLAQLEKALVAGVNSPKIRVPFREIEEIGLLAALRKRGPARRR